MVEAILPPYRKGDYNSPLDTRHLILTPHWEGDYNEIFFTLVKDELILPPPLGG